MWNHLHAGMHVGGHLVYTGGGSSAASVGSRDGVGGSLYMMVYSCCPKSFAFLKIDRCLKRTQVG